MVKRMLTVWLAMLPLVVAAQEVLLPLQAGPVVLRPAGKTATGAVALPFFDDFAAGGLNPALWQGNEVGVTCDVSPLAPTVGVATLDAFDAEGRLYPQASTALFPADTLLSVPLRLDGLTAADSVVLSFFYLPGGGYGNMWERMGEAPDAQDSLFLDFYSPQDSMWVTVWSRGGVSVDSLLAYTNSAWQYVVVPLTDGRYFDSAFCFRFRNYASLESSPKAGKAGNGDFWHLDCVMMGRGRDAGAGPAERDVAFAAPAPSLLRDYRAMPYRQYSPSALADRIEMKIVNRYGSPLATQYSYTVVDSAGNEVGSYDGGFENAPAEALQTLPAHATPPVNVTFGPMTAPVEYTVVHTVREGTGGDVFPQNDTVRYRQRFGDYFAYDDGSAENGYGLTSTASRLYLAYRFDLGNADTLTAVDLWFNYTYNQANEAIPFYLTVWSVGADGAPSEVLYRDEMRRMPRGGGFSRYVLEQPLAVDGGSLFVGMEQSGNDYINLGFDRSRNTSDRIWYLTGTEWQQSILSGSLMMRPAFGAAATVGVERRAERLAVRLYPVPANEVLCVEGLPDGSVVQLYDAWGRAVTESRTVGRGHLEVAHLPNGLYLVRMLTPDGDTQSAKIIVKH